MTAKKPSKPKPVDPMVLTIVEFVANQCASGAHLTRHELEDYRYKLGMIRSEVRAARDQALKLGLITEKQLPPQERRGMRQHYLYAPGGKACNSAPARPSITPAPSGNAPAQPSVVAETTISDALLHRHAELLAAVETLMREYRTGLDIRERLAQVESELALARAAVGADKLPVAEPTTEPTSLWPTLGLTAEEFMKRGELK